MYNLLILNTNTNCLYLHNVSLYDGYIEYNIIESRFDDIIYKSRRVKQAIKFDKNNDGYIMLFNKFKAYFHQMQAIKAD